MMATPIYTSQPSNISTLNNQFSNPALLQQLAQSDPVVSGALQSLEQQRVYAGSAPYSTNQAIGAAIAAQGQGLATRQSQPNPWLPQNFFHNAVHDVGNVVTNIPNMPFQIVQEASKIPQIPHDVASNFSPSKIGGVFNAPVIRMIPGAQTLSAALPGGTPAGNIISHPVNTALDLTPYAVAKVFPARFAGLGEAAGEADKVSSAMTSLADNVAGKPTPAPNMVSEEAGLAGSSGRPDSGGAADLADQAKPGRVSAAQIVGNSAPYQALVSKAVNPAVDYLANTGAGNYVREAVGPEARNLSRSYTVADQTARREKAAALATAAETGEPVAPIPTKTDNISNWLNDVSQQRYATPRVQMEAELNLRPQAEEMAQRQPIEGMPVETQIQRNMDYLMKQKGYDTPQANYNGQTLYGNQDMVVPKRIQNNINRLVNPATKNPILKLTDPLTKLMRVTHLNLSPVFPFHRGIGDLTKMLSDASGKETLDYISNIKDYLSSVKEIRKNPNIESTRLEGMDIPVSDWLKTKMHGQAKMEQLWNESSANTQVRLLKELSDSGAGKFFKRIGSGVNKASKFGMEASSFFDDVFTSMKYLSDTKSALEEGLTKAEAIERGESAAQRVMMDWTDATPIERQVMKSIMPFYGYAQHIIRYSLKYPEAHPWRASIVNAFAQAEQQDQQSGLPDSFRQLFQYGKPDAQGNRSALDLSALNPFKSVANYFTLPGLTRAMNPAIQVGMEQLGVNPQKGSPDLYPNLHYNPDTGQLEYQRPGLLSSLLPTVLPQAQAIEELTGNANAYRQLERSNPEAAKNLILSEFGLTNPIKSVNPTQAIMKSEINAEKAQQTALSTALRSGDSSGLKRWPQAKARFDQLQQMAAAGQISNYLPQDSVGSAYNSLASSVSGR